ncbi:MAG TPA: dihydroxyacetone kinase phosphoryl donor subunit DhaM [Cellulomonas sp.]|uniref:dihydroxyacetone kinase phosphoryl donor subunit DhaM n=1 Tax=Cellulomonas sp. TaxID=40001 RepID=UPI002E300B35|nr:dihydroxyacetone kinase phosphoryl donor subunit DhaM [Cellulomonas sp.]HEX5333369.1 dihydroxyacetone kinase phosphoryl donor subunit DhaM [Cellulomonas sp.]
MPAQPAVRVALVLVSHSRALAEGAVELAAQMAPRVTLLAAGGDGAGGLGTSFDAVESAVTAATADGRSAVVLTDLGSAVLTTESVLDLLDDDVAARVRIADAPFVEGAVAAAVTADGGADLAGVLASAEGAGATFAGSASAAGVDDAPAVEASAARDELAATVTLRNRLGLHARPAAILARLMAGFDAVVVVDGVNAASVLELMTLGAVGGHELDVRVSGPQRAEALAALVEAVEGGFGEV